MPDAFGAFHQPDCADAKDCWSCGGTFTCGDCRKLFGMCCAGQLSRPGPRGKVHALLCEDCAGLALVVRERGRRTEATETIPAPPPVGMTSRPRSPMVPNVAPPEDAGESPDVTYADHIQCARLLRKFHKLAYDRGEYVDAGTFGKAIQALERA